MELTSGITLPLLPKNEEEIIEWAAGLHKALHRITSLLSRRLNGMIIEGLAASIPAASGSKRFYFATDTSKLYYDGGTWVILN